MSLAWSCLARGGGFALVVDTLVKHARNSTTFYEEMTSYCRKYIRQISIETQIIQSLDKAQAHENGIIP